MYKAYCPNKNKLAKSVKFDNNILQNKVHYSLTLVPISYRKDYQFNYEKREKNNSSYKTTF